MGCASSTSMDPARVQQIKKARDEYIPCTEGPEGVATKRVLAYCKEVPCNEGLFGDSSDAMLHLADIGATLMFFEHEHNVLWKSWELFGKHKEPFAKHVELMEDDLPWPAKNNAWRDDYEWGYQRLNGLMPFLVRRCDAIPESMAAQLAADDAAKLAGLLPPGESLEDLVKAKRIFIVDHTDLEGCPVHEGRYLCPSRTLLLSTGKNDTKAPALPGETIPEGPLFRPIAIQLVPKADAPVITPVHPPVPGLWAAAKLHAIVPDAAVQIFFEHVVSIHLCNEAFWMSMCRTMADVHPVKQMIKPHMHVTLYMGEQFRNTTYINPKGALPTLHACGVTGGYWIMEKKLETWKMTDHDQSRYYKERGTDELEGYTMRDDSKAHWELIHKYCTRVVEILYPKGAGIKEDLELQAFVRELHNVGRVNGIPCDSDGGISKAEDLAMLLSIPLYVGCVKHSLADNAAYDFYGFAPNTPLSFMLPPPVTQEAIDKQVEAGGFTDEILSDNLQQGGDAVLQVALVRANKPIHKDKGIIDKFQSFIAQNGKDWGVEGHPQIAAALKTWQDDLVKLEAEIDKRNETLQPRPYPYLKPSDMSNSIWY